MKLETPEIRQSIQRMVCTACGAEANASCNCGVTYQPKSIRAAEAIKANPEKSDRAIAKEIGASPTTVGKAREELSSGGQLKDEPRTGLDGKTRKLPEKKPEQDEEEDDVVELLLEKNKLQDRVSQLTEAINAKEKRKGATGPPI